MNETGTVKAISNKTTRNGKAYKLLVVASENSGDMFFNCFFTPACSVGDEIAFEYELDGDFTNILGASIKVVSKAPEESAPTTQAKGGKRGGYSPEERRSIENQVILKEVTNYLHALATADALKKTNKRADMLLAAEEFVEFARGVLGHTSNSQETVDTDPKDDVPF